MFYANTIYSNLKVVEFKTNRTFRYYLVWYLPSFSHMYIAHLLYSFI